MSLADITAIESSLENFRPERPVFVLNQYPHFSSMKLRTPYIPSKI